MRGVLPDDVVKGIEEQLSGACTTEIAAFDEFTALLTDTGIAAELRPRRLRHRADRAHHPAPAAAWRVDRVPGRRARATPPASGRWPASRSSARSTRRAVDALADTSRTRMVLVDTGTARRRSREVARTHEELAAIGTHATSTWW